MKNVSPHSASAFSPEAELRLRRLRRVAWVLDRIFPVGGGRCIGIDPIIGLIPGFGDWVATALSVYLLYEAARLGLPLHVLVRIAVNIAIEGMVGSIPIAGDLFDFVFQANMRNLRLVEQYYRPEMRPRSFAAIWLALAGFTLFLLALVALAIFALFQAMLFLLR